MLSPSGTEAPQLTAGDVNLGVAPVAVKIVKI
jgi:hypothetical protein